MPIEEILREYFMEKRRALLAELDSIERLLGLPRTSELRRKAYLLGHEYEEYEED